ncbi:MAG TPA: hypothetical protein VGE02_02480 [Gemmatimonadales bacterium]
MGDERATCPIVDCDAAARLAAAVSAAKRRAGSPGGSFAINEYGQVLVPTGDGEERCMIVGEWHGPLRFHDSFSDDATFDLCDVRRLSAGAPWNRPYVGIPYKLGADGRIGFVRGDGWSARTIYPVRQDRELAAAIARLRGSSGARFLVAPSGIVLTKVPPTRRPSADQETWSSVYVGRIDFRKWFTKEEA